MIDKIMSEEELAFRRFIITQKCPFRLKTEKRTNGDIEQHYMSCDPDCMALLHNDDEKAFTCLRCVNLTIDAEDDYASMFYNEEGW